MGRVKALALTEPLLLILAAARFALLLAAADCRRLLLLCCFSVVAKALREEMKTEVDSLRLAAGGESAPSSALPTLAVVLVGLRKDSQTYVAMKTKVSCSWLLLPPLFPCCLAGVAVAEAVSLTSVCVCACVRRCSCRRALRLA